MSRAQGARASGEGAAAGYRATQRLGYRERLFRDQVPFGLSRAINETAKEAQARQRAGMAERFTIRRPQFVNRAIKIKPFATKRRLAATIQVDPPGGPARADILTRHELPGTREPLTGTALAVPIQVRANRRDIVKKRDRPKAFAFTHVRTGRGGVEIFAGRRRTFMLRWPDGRGRIFQRVGPGEVWQPVHRDDGTLRAAAH